ncbi:flippase-like domain-containing protein [Patescibacteria group bacterium]|nr:flippase-like domain-containing protein [Patescibacteria group bacterium]
MKKIFLFLVPLLIGISLFVFVIKFVGWEEIKRVILVFSGWQGIMILGLTLLIILVATWKWKEILKGVGAKISFKDLPGLYLASFSIMYLFPIMILGGEILRGYVLKEKNKVPWPKGMASVIIDRVLEWTANLVVVFFGFLFFLLTIGFPPGRLGVILGSVFLIFTAALIFFYFKSFKRESMVRFFIRGSQNNQPLEIEKEIFSFFKIKEKHMWRVFGLSFLRAIIMLLRTWVLIGFLGKNIGFLPTLSILGFSYLAVMIPIPTALGIHEMAQVFAFGALGLGTSAGMAFTMIIRGADLIFAIVGVFILFRLGLKLLEKTLFKNQNL